ncbi:protein TolQ [Pseudomonadales bacterium]|nr:protein TolQ [Pseudomonadales bacterium]MDB4420802.1 protein TolQ [Pseudomonadales bacterium]MDB4529174.1 protein TolQ [Pseudomonadales bacterium]MDB4542098.1 protein TolQ [Pseudomonadales bacterium]MDB4631328.1 protein TolQ [Pseudomonadales bacterium]
MNEQLPIWQLISEATILVQAVMLLLMLASIISWVMIFQRAAVYRRARKQLLDFEDEFWSGIDLGQLYRSGSVRAEQETITGVESIFRAGFKEFSRLRQQSGMEFEAVMAGSERAMRVALAREDEELGRHLPFLANVGSASPYVGLLGTVWGIMNSFRGLANTHQATLASVAPGISEALIATAMGLFAAIPAVIAYNRFSARVDMLMSRYETFAEEFSGILHRQAHNNDR